MCSSLCIAISLPFTASRENHQLNKYEVTVFAVGDDGDETKLGTASVEATSLVDAQRLAIDELWDARLDSAGCKARYISRQV